MKLLHLQIVDDLARHLVSFELILELVFKVASYDIEELIFQQEAVGKTSLVPNGSHEHVLPFGHFALLDHADLLEVLLFSETD